MMKKKLQKFIAFSFAFTALLYLLAALTPYVNPKYFFPLSFLSIGFPLLLIVLTFFFIYFLFTQKKKAFICFIIIACAYKNIFNNIGLSCSSKKDLKHKSIRLLSWNVRDFKEENKLGAKISASTKYLEYLKQQNADIVCLQDVTAYSSKTNLSFLDSIAKQCQFPYYYFSKDIDTFKQQYNLRECYGTCIFSKFPITFSNHINYDGESFTESLAYADLNIQGKKLRIYNTHLKSMYIKIQPYQTQADFPYKIEDTNLVFHSTAFEKIKAYDLIHVQQAQKIKSVFDTTSVDFIFCGDLNSTPSSFVYHTLKKGLQDGYLNHNLGWQNTYASRIPGMRIDVIFLSKKIKSTDFVSSKYRLSDHFPNVCEFVIE